MKTNLSTPTPTPNGCRGRSQRASARLAAIGIAIAASIAMTANAAELLAGSASGGRLVLFGSDAPDDVAVMHVRGLQTGEEILGLDRRPATGELYALGSSSRLYTIDLVTGLANMVGPGPFTPALNGTRFGFDFNPTVDRIRIVSDLGQNLRVHPVTGAIAAVDGQLAYTAEDSGFGLSPMVVASAYINNDTNPDTGTLLYNLDADRDVLVIQNPPNAGALTTVGSLGVDILGLAGFDVAGSDGLAYASLVVAGQAGNSDRASLYTVNLTTGAVTWMGKIGGPKPLMSLATLGTMP